MTATSFLMFKNEKLDSIPLKENRFRSIGIGKS